MRNIIKQLFKYVFTGEIETKAVSESARAEIFQLPQFGNLFSQFFTSLFTLNYNRLIRYHEYDMMDLLLPEISSALDIYKAEVMQKKDESSLFIVDSNAKNLNQMYQKLLHVWIEKFEAEHGIIFSDLIRRLLKYGDLFLDPIFLEIDGVRLGVLGFRYIDERKVNFAFVRNEELDKYRPTWVYYPQRYLPQLVSGTSVGKSYSSTILTQMHGPMAKARQGLAEIQDQLVFNSEADFRAHLEREKAIELKDVIHIPIQPSVFIPYGTSVLETLRLKWRQLKLLQDALILYRIFKSVKRIVWKVKLGKMPPKEAERYFNDFIKRIRNVESFRGQTFPDETSRVLALLEDLFIPETEGREVAIDTLDQSANIENIEDILLIVREMELGLKIPRPRILHQRGEGMTHQYLALQDAHWASFINDLQGYICLGLRKLLITHIKCQYKNAAKGNNKHEKSVYEDVLTSIRVSMKKPLSIVERDYVDTMNSKLDFVSRLLDILQVTDVQIRKKIVKDFLQFDIESYEK